MPVPLLTRKSVVAARVDHAPVAQGRHGGAGRDDLQLDLQQMPVGQAGERIVVGDGVKLGGVILDLAQRSRHLAKLVVARGRQWRRAQRRTP